MSPLIVVDSVHLTLRAPTGPVNVLRGVDLAVEAGTSIAIVGPSGSGKSSLLAVIAGLEPATDGRVTVADVDVGALDENGRADWRRQNLGILFQSFHLVPTLTALENVAVPLELAGREDAEERARTGLERVGLGARLGHRPSQLSGGEQQRVALARALVAGPKLILADEPTGNLDGDTARAVADLLFALPREDGATLLLITHDPALAARADRQVRMHDGRVDHTPAAGREAAA
ncbi:MAG: ABC transporter ATP-binding protein [Pseudomonadota bacterium]